VPEWFNGYVVSLNHTGVSILQKDYIMSRSLIYIDLQTPFVEPAFKGSKSWFDMRVPFTKFQNVSLDTFGFTPSTIFNFELEFTGRYHDHAGFRIGFGCMFFEVIFQWYDSRHAIEDEDQ